MRLPMLTAALLILALTLQGCGRPPASALGFRADEVVAVVVSWEPTLDRVPPPRRTTDRRQFSPLLAALERVSQQSSPPDLLGPPIHFSLELRSGQTRRFELWPPYLADRDANVLYWLPDDLFHDLRSALEPLSPPPIPAPGKLSGTIAPADLVRALQEHGAKGARGTGEVLPAPLFGASAGHVIEVLGQKVQVYTMGSPEAAARAAALDPKDMPVEWQADPHFVAVGNLVVTVVVPDRDMAAKVVAYLQMVRS